MTPSHLSKHKQHARSESTHEESNILRRPAFKTNPQGCLETIHTLNTSGPSSYMCRDKPLDPRIAEILLENNNILRVEREKRFNEVIALIMTNQRDNTQLRQEMSKIRQEMAAVRDGR